MFEFIDAMTILELLHGISYNIYYYIALSILFILYVGYVCLIAYILRCLSDTLGVPWLFGEENSGTYQPKNN